MQVHPAVCRSKTGTQGTHIKPDIRSYGLVCLKSSSSCAAGRETSPLTGVGHPSETIEVARHRRHRGGPSVLGLHLVFVPLGPACVLA